MFGSWPVGADVEGLPGVAAAPQPRAEPGVKWPPAGWYRPAFAGGSCGGPGRPGGGRSVACCAHRPGRPPRRPLLGAGGSGPRRGAGGTGGPHGPEGKGVGGRGESREGESKGSEKERGSGGAGPEGEGSAVRSQGSGFGISTERAGARGAARLAGSLTPPPLVGRNLGAPGSPPRPRSAPPTPSPTPPPPPTLFRDTRQGLPGGSLCGSSTSGSKNSAKRKTRSSSLFLEEVRE